jgi:hypothetical protein
MASRQRQVSVTVYPEDEAPVTYSLANDKEWSVIFEDVLEIKSVEGTFYYPLGAVMRWVVR